MFEAIIYGSLAGLATIFGIFSVLWKQKQIQKYSIYLVAFAVGVLLSASFFELLPEAIKITPNALLYALLGFMAFFLIETAVTIHTCKEENCKEHRLGVMSVLGLSIHSLIDGIAIGAGFELSPEIGLIATLAVIVHEFPEGVITLSLLLNAKIERAKAILYSVIVAVATPVGAIATAQFASGFPKEWLGILLAFTAGTFLYVAAADLVPETHNKFSRLNAIFVILGILFVVILQSTFG